MSGKEKDLTDVVITPVGSESEIWYHSGSHGYWLKDGTEYKQFKQRDLKEYLKIQRQLMPQVKSGNVASELDCRVSEITLNARVDYVCDNLAGYTSGVHTFGGGFRVLVAKMPVLIEPEPCDWPTIRTLLQGLFIPKNGSVAQLRMFLGWSKLAIEPLYEGNRPQLGHAVAICGEPNCGKSFLVNHVVKPLLGDRIAMPWAFFVGDDRFNAEMSQAALWVCDDESSELKYKDRMSLGKRMKAVCATPDMRYRGMHKDAQVLNTHRRIVLVTNLEPENLGTLPPITGDLEDKIMLFRAYDGFKEQDVVPHTTLPEQRALLSEITKELPAFVHYLLEEHEIDEADQGNRYGIREYHSPDIMARLLEISWEAQLMDYIDRTLFPEPVGEIDTRSDNLRYTAAELLAELASLESPLEHHERNALPKRPQTMGTELGKLAKLFPDRFSHHRSAKNNGWIISKPPPDEADEA